MKKLAYRFSTVVFIVVLMAALLPVPAAQAAVYIELDGRSVPDGIYYWPSATLPNPLNRDVVLINGAKLILVSGLPAYTATIACSSLGDFASAFYVNSGKVDIIAMSGTSVSTDRGNLTEFSIVGASSGSCWGGIHINQGASASLDRINIRDANYGITFASAHGSIRNSVIQYIYGRDQSAPTIPAQTGIGVWIDGNYGTRTVTIENTQIHHIYGGNGLTVDDTNPNPGFAAGGQAIGINITSGATPEIINSSINNINGGDGGTGAAGVAGANGTVCSGNPSPGGHGANGQNGYSGGAGGDAYGIVINGASPTIHELTSVTSVFGGKGGNGGQGGAGGLGAAGCPATAPLSNVETEGGTGGNGGHGGNGGNGGNAGKSYGVSLSSNAAPIIRNIGISSIGSSSEVTAGNAGMGGPGGQAGNGAQGSPTDTTVGVGGWGGSGGIGGNGGQGGQGGNAGDVVGLLVNTSAPVIEQVVVSSILGSMPGVGADGRSGGNGGVGGLGGNASGAGKKSGHGGYGGPGGSGGMGGAGGLPDRTAGLFLDAPLASMTSLETVKVDYIRGVAGKPAGKGGNAGAGGAGGNAGSYSSGATRGDGGNGGNAGAGWKPLVSVPPLSDDPYTPDGLYYGYGGRGGAGGSAGLSSGNERFRHPMGIGIYYPAEGFIIRNNIVTDIEGKIGGSGGTYGNSACGGVGGAGTVAGTQGNPKPDPITGCVFAGVLGRSGKSASTELLYASFLGTNPTPTNVFVTNNTLVHNRVDSSNPADGQTASGILADDSVAFIAYNNIVTNPTSQSLSVGLRAINSGTIPEFNYNDIWNWQSQWGGTVTPDPNYNIAVDPNFDTTVGGQDKFHLIFGAGASACVDGGWDMAPGLPQFDYHGTARIIDSNNDGVAQPDMGAYENGCYLEFEQTAFYKKRPFTNLPIKVLKTGDPTLFASATTYSSQHGTIDWVYSGGLAWASNDATPLYLTTSLYSFDYGGWFEITITPTAGCFIKPETSTVRVLIPQWFLPIQIQMP